jgi:phage-related baseplate assembly protein
VSNIPPPWINLPAISFADVDVATMVNQMVAGYQASWLAQTGEQVVLTPSNRIYHHILAIAGYLENAYEQLDIACKQNVLPLALGGFIDNLVSMYGPRSLRLGGSEATTTLQFTLPAALTTPVTIPSGTQAGSSSTNGSLVFATLADAIIPAGQVAVNASAACTVPGALGNGAPINSVTTLINWSPSFVVSVSNTTVSGQPPETAGVDPESDDNYKNRMWYVTDSFSTCGPKKAYEFWALTADPNITQATVMGPEDGLTPGNVWVTIAGPQGQQPTSAQIQSVYNTCNADDNRDLCAQLTVAGPSGIAFTVNVSYEVPDYNINQLSAIQTNVRNAVNSTIQTWTWNLATDVDPSIMEWAMVQAGGVQVSVIAPAAPIEVSLNQIAILTDDPIITYIGLES